MTTVTDLEIQEIEELLNNFQQQIKKEQKKINNHLSDLEPKNTINDNKLIDISCNLQMTTAKLKGNNANVETNKTKIEALEKRIIDSFFKVQIQRLTNQDFLLRTIISAVIITATSIASTTMLNYLWNHPLF